MREECKHFQSRSYNTGEVVRFCELDLAPEAPWRCPDGCPSYSRRLADVGWVHGSLVEPAIEDEPGPGGEDVVRLLEEASDIVDAVMPQTVADVEREERKAPKRPARPGGSAASGKRRWPWSRG
jgi:hypothetical protein